MSIIESNARLIANDVAGSAAGTIDPTVITDIMAIITDVLKTFGACGNTPAQAQARMAHPGLVEKLALRNSIRHHVQLISLRVPLFYSTLKFSSTLQVGDVQDMMLEAGAKV